MQDIGLESSLENNLRDVYMFSCTIKSGVSADGCGKATVRMAKVLYYSFKCPFVLPLTLVYQIISRWQKHYNAFLVIGFSPKSTYHKVSKEIKRWLIDNSTYSYECYNSWSFICNKRTIFRYRHLIKQWISFLLQKPYPQAKGKLRKESRACINTRGLQIKSTSNTGPR